MAEAMLNEDIRNQVRELFNEISGEVAVFFFGSDDRERCPYCQETHQLLEEVTGLSEKLFLYTYDIERDSELAGQYRIEAAPTFIMLGKEHDQFTDFGVRFKGIPAGHEFSSFVNDLVLVSRRDSGLQKETKDYLKQLDTPVHLQVFVTPTCPYCPRAVVLAHQLAMESPWVEAEMVEAMEFPELANRFDVNGVPQTTINYGAVNVVGAVPEQQLIDQIKEAINIQQGQYGRASNLEEQSGF
jgi:glutaredoxin-like protein